MDLTAHSALFEAAAQLLLQHQLFNHRLTIPYESCILSEEYASIVLPSDNTDSIQRLKHLIAVKQQVLERLAYFRLTDSSAAFLSPQDKEVCW